MRISISIEAETIGSLRDALKAIRVAPSRDESISILPLSVRAYNGLVAEGIATVGDLVSRSESELLRLPNIGRKTMDEIIGVLREVGLQLGSP